MKDRRKRGRPPVNADDRRSGYFSVRVSFREYDRIVREALRTGVSLSELIRRRACGRFDVTH
jgi:predicted HicB family RNase H-like nuclease